MGKHHGTMGEVMSAAQALAEGLAKEDVVAQNQAGRLAGDELLAQNEGLGNATGLRLFKIGQANAEAAAVTQQALILRQVVWRRDDGNLADACKHQHRQRIVNHRLVIDWQQLLADRQRRRI